MRLLLANDDGVYSPGLAALAEGAAELGEIHIGAPDVEQSSMGHAITATHPIRARPTAIGDLQAHRVNGTPADCVALGLHQWPGVDVVLSGLNIGLNLGHAVWHSGTLAAAKQAALLGVRGIALSAPAAMEEDVSPLAPWLDRVLRLLLVEWTDVPLVNVNFPREPRGLVWTRASTAGYDGRIVPARDPLDREVYWFTVAPVASSEDRSDRWAVEQRWVSLTPLSLDVTDDTELARLRAAVPLDDATAVRVSPPISTAREAEAVRAEESATAGAPGPRRADDGGTG